MELLAATGASPTFETVALIVWLGSDEDVMVAFSPVEMVAICEAGTVTTAVKVDKSAICSAAPCEFTACEVMPFCTFRSTTVPSAGAETVSFSAFAAALS